MKLAAALATVALTLAPRLAAACPHCAGREEDGGNARLLLLGGMILFPFAVVGVAVQVIRRGRFTSPES